jgi:hypothetical protein
MHTHADCASGKCSYQDYIFQFVTPEVKQCITRIIPLDQIVKAAEVSDIPKALWNKAGIAALPLIEPLVIRAETRATMTLMISIVHAAAFQMRKDAQFLQSGTIAARDYMAAHHAMKDCLAKAMAR